MDDPVGKRINVKAPQLGALARANDTVLSSYVLQLLVLNRHRSHNEFCDMMGLVQDTTPME